MDRTMSVSSTSLEALESLMVTDLENRVLAAIEAIGKDGCISDELRACFPTLAYSSVTARYAALEEKGLIYRAGDTRPGESGRKQKVMRSAKWLSEVPIVPVTKKLSPFIRGFAAAAKIVCNAETLDEAKQQMAQKIRKARTA